MARPDRIDVKLFFVLWIASLAATGAVLPYTLAMASDQMSRGPVPLSVVMLAQVIQAGLLFAAAIAGGLWAARRTGFELPILKSYLSDEALPAGWSRWILSASLIGILAGAAILVLDRWVFRPLLLPASSALLSGPAGNPAAWKGLLASFYGGITEEILLRLGLLSLFAWLGNRIAGNRPAEIVRTSRGVFWTANLLTALVFGLGHLPATSLLVPITPLVVARAIILNGLGGVVFGFLYYRNGLESAMTAHFAADLVLHVVAVLPASA